MINVVGHIRARITVQYNSFAEDYIMLTDMIVFEGDAGQTLKNENDRRGKEKKMRKLYNKRDKTT